MYTYKEGEEIEKKKKKQQQRVDKRRREEGKKNRGGSEQPSDKTIRVRRHTERNNNNYILCSQIYIHESTCFMNIITLHKANTHTHTAKQNKRSNKPGKKLIQPFCLFTVHWEKSAAYLKVP